MRKIITYLICLMSFGLSYGQIDTLNQKYFAGLRNLLCNDINVKEIKYIVENFDNGNIKDQHVYVKYKNDSIDRFWRIGKCFHYSENGKLVSESEIDYITRKFIGVSATYKENGDTLSATFWSNYKDLTLPTYSIFKVDDLGKVYELYTDKFDEVKYKKGKRVKKKSMICVQKGCINYRIEYYNPDGTVKRIKDKSDLLNEFEIEL